MKTLKHLALAALAVAGLLLPMAMTRPQPASAGSVFGDICRFLGGCTPFGEAPCLLSGGIDSSDSTTALHYYRYDMNCYGDDANLTHLKGWYVVGTRTAHEELTQKSSGKVLLLANWSCPDDPWSYDWSSSTPAPCSNTFVESGGSFSTDGVGQQTVPFSTLHIDVGAHLTLAAGLQNALYRASMEQAAKEAAAKEAAKQAAIHAALFTTTTTEAGCGAACSALGSIPANETTSITATGSGSTAASVFGSSPANEATSITATGSGSTAASVFGSAPPATPTPSAAAPAPARVGIASNDPSTVPAWPQLSSSSAQGEAVKSLQYLLQQCGATTLSADGKFSPETDAAVRAFQKAQGLPDDGKVGAATWQALIVPPMQPMQPGMPMPPMQMCMPMQPMPQGMSMPPMQQGSTGPAVQAVQSQLKSRGVTLTVDGVFGKTTDTAVKAYQKGQGITANGQVGADTWQFLLAGS